MMSDIDGGGSGVVADNTRRDDDQTTALLEQGKREFGISAENLADLREQVTRRRSRAFDTSDFKGDAGESVALIRFRDAIDKSLAKDIIDKLPEAPEEEHAALAKHEEGLAGLTHEAEIENDAAAAEPAVHHEAVTKEEPVAETEEPEAAPEVAVEAKSGLKTEVIDGLQEVLDQLREASAIQVKLEKEAEEMSSALEKKKQELAEATANRQKLSDKFLELSKELA